MPEPSNGFGAEKSDLPSVEAIEFRKASGCFLTGVTIVTTIDEKGVPWGVTANSFTSVSLDPPLALVCIGRNSRSISVFERTNAFAVNILAAHQRELSNAFASSKNPDKFAGIEWRPTAAGAAVFDASAAWLDCALHQRIEAGDHIILIGRVVGLSRSAVTPLGYYGGSYVNFDADRQAIEATDHENVRVGAVLESDGALLFLDDGQKLSLPIAKFLGEAVNEPGSLLEQLAKLEVAAAVNFVYSVYDDPKDRCMYVFYRGEIVSGPPSSQTKAVLLPFDEIPWDRLEKNAGLVRRYIRERTSDSFGLYVGTAARGSVHKTMLATSERSA